MAFLKIAQLTVVVLVFLFVNDCDCTKLTERERSFDAQVQLFRAAPISKANRRKMRKHKRKWARYAGQLDFTTQYFLNANGNFTGGCKKVRVSRYIGNPERKCTSFKPVKYSLCGGFCLPKFRLAQIAAGRPGSRALEKARYRWRCAAGSFRFKKVRVYCPDDGSVLVYRIRLIRNCVCKEFKREHNDARTAAGRLEDWKIQQRYKEAERRKKARDPR